MLSTRRIKYSLFSVFFTLAGCASESPIEYQGYVDGDFTHIASPFSGQVEQLLVKEGDQIKAGQLLTKLDLEPQLSQFNRAKFELESAEKTLSNLMKGERITVIRGIEAEIDKAQSELKLSQLRLDRARTLFEKNLSNKDTLDQASTEFTAKSDIVKALIAKLEEAKQGSREDIIDSQKALVNAAKAKVNELQWSIEAKTLHAPDDGVVTDIYFRKGEFVPPSARILSLLTPSNQKIVFFVPIAKINDIKLQDTVKLDCEGCKKQYEANISYISPKVEYTPPLIFSRQHHNKYSYKIHAKLNTSDVQTFHVGQPVYVSFKEH